ncbi:autotransporter domain-containing protein (plasmid) [Agrobacterium salinitolerans]|uniref:autotransporter outer membrane beta-barrel domain-containing protein n=1 Tax=Agrobacterium salinitolerans TaxID=1183413 RepID=UPI001C248994|nr:autotransporter domain-containing protein [Agrobacterium salinitolerans]QXC52412.1 autotransporter domain-containing protein [Agrobacterium salinitolerans]
MTGRAREWLTGSRSLGIAACVGLAATIVNAQTVQITTSTTTPVNPATLATPAGTIHVTETGSIDTLYAGNHAIQPYVSGGTTGRWDIIVDGFVRATSPVPTHLYGVWLRGGGDVTVGATGSVEGSNSAIMIDTGYSDVVNYGTVTGIQSSISLQGGGSVTNYGTLVGGVVGASVGVPSSFVNAQSGTVTASGPVSGSSPFGFLLNAGGSLENAGTVSFNNVAQGLWSRADTVFVNTGTYSVLADAGYAPQTSGALFQTGKLVATNTGTFAARDLGFFGYQNSDVSISNSGSITTEKLDAIYVRYATGTINISQTDGHISGGRNGIVVRDSAASTVDISGGIVDAGTYDAAGVGLLFNNSDSAVLTVGNASINAPTAIKTIGGSLSANLLDGATINGDVSFDAADDRLTLATGAKVNGTIDGGGGSDTFQLAGTGSAVLDAAISNFEALSVLGGAWTLDGNYSFSDGAVIDGGSLAVNGILDAAVTVGDGARLQGNGSIGATTLASGAVIAPGNSIGTINVAGDITFAASSSFEVEVDPASGDSDFIHATGTAYLNNAAVEHIGMAGSYRPLSTYTILTADGGVVGTFGSVTSAYAFLTPELGYDANSVSLRLERNSTAFSDGARTRNQKATAEAAESLGAGEEIYDAIVLLPDDDTLIGSAFDLLSGEIHASARTALLEDSHFLRDSVSERMHAAFGDAPSSSTAIMAYGPDGLRPAQANTSGVAPWGHAFGAWGRTDGDGNASGLDRTSSGFLAGVDAALSPNVRLGVFTGYGHSSFDVDGRSSSGSSENYHLGLYGGGLWGGLRLTSGLAYTWHDVSTNRSVAFTGFADSPSADHDAGTFQVFGEAGYRFDTPAASVEPFANLAYVNLHTGSFSEDGGAAALAVDSRTSETTFTTLGLHAATGVMLGSMKATARGTLGWRHAFGDRTPLSTHSFAGSDSFTVAGAPIAEDAVIIQAALDLGLTERTMLGLSYNGQIADPAEEHALRARLSVRF